MGPVPCRGKTREIRETRQRKANKENLSHFSLEHAFRFIDIDYFDICILLNNQKFIIWIYFVDCELDKVDRFVYESTRQFLVSFN